MNDIIYILNFYNIEWYTRETDFAEYDILVKNITKTEPLTFGWYVYSRNLGSTLLFHLSGALSKL